MKYQKGSFITIPNKNTLQGLKPLLQTTFFWICNYADDDGVCFPSRKRLSEDIGVSIDSLDLAIKDLIDIGLIEKIIRKNGKENLTNIYQVKLVEVGEKTTLPSREKHPTPSREFPTVTQSNTNSNINNSGRSSDEDDIEYYPNFQIPVRGDIYEDSVEVNEQPVAKLFWSNTNRPLTNTEIKQLTTKKKEFKPKVKESFNYEEELRKLSESFHKTNKIVALIWFHKKYRFENALQMQAQFDIDKTYGAKLKGYSGDQISKAIELCKEEAEELGYDWKASTVVKKITEIL